MTTVEPGASEVFTQGLTSRPRSTAFLASRPAPIITDGFDVFVQLVIAAITTRPWSRSNVVAVGVGDLDAVAAPALAGDGGRARARPDRSVGEPDAVSLPLPGGSEAGNEPVSGSRSVPSAPAASSLKLASVSKNAAFASVSAIRSCGRFGPAIAGTTSPRSSSSVSLNVGSSEPGSWNMPCSRV